MTNFVVKRKNFKILNIIIFISILFIGLSSYPLNDCYAKKKTAKNKITKVKSPKNKSSKKQSKASKKNTKSTKKIKGKKYSKKSEEQSPNYKSSGLKSQQAELDNLNKEIARTREKINSLMKQEKSTVKNLNSRKKESARLSAYIDILIAKINTIQESISNLKSFYSRLNIKQTNIQNDYASLSQKFYFENDITTTEQIITGKTFSEENLYDCYFQYLSRELDVLAERISFMKDSIEKKTNVLKAISNENQFIKSKKEKENKLIKNDIANNQKLLKNIKVNQSALQKQLAEKQKSAIKLKSIIKNLIQQEIAKQKAAEKKATHSKDNIASNTKSEEKGTTHPKYNVEYQTSTKHSVPSGRYIWPVPGRSILRGYGANKNPGSNTIFDNPGIDISAKIGTPVEAVASGSVSLIHWLPGYGKLVIINHGNGIRSVYANLSSVSVTKGQEIKQGKIIGRTGESVDGQFLHFELWSGSSRLNPSSYLR